MTNTNSCSESSNSASSCEKVSPQLLVFGNPLLDVTVQISNEELLKKYNLERNGQAEVSLEKLNNLFNDARARYKTFKFSLGGSGLNSSRILAALGQRDLMFYGAIGNDQNGKVVKEILKRSGVNACLQELKVRTGTCVCLCHGSDRSLVANIGAALKCGKAFIAENIKSITNDPSFYYIEGFFIPDKMDSVRFLHERFSQNPNTKFITNLNAPYIVKTFQKDVTWMVKKADIVFGNRDEFEELATINGFQSLEDLLKDFLSEYTKANQEKIIVITDGANPVVFYEGSSNGLDCSSVNVPIISQEDIVDTTGAGDSFVAGYIFALMKGKAVRECIEFGSSISAEVIKTIGCNLPENAT